jgi:hypothetical protein
MKPLAVFALLLLLPSFLCAETLHDILARNGIPESSFSKTELAQDGAGLAQDFAGNVVVAFAPLNNNIENAVLRVIRFDRADKDSLVTKRDLTGSDISSECVHSVFDISRYAGRLFLIADINPSASCTIMLNARDLVLQGTFFGWPDAHVGESGMVFEEDQVHFQPVHPLRLRFVDLKNQSAPEIYPPDHDSLREKFAAELRKHVPSHAWCADNNNPCDPLNFEEEIRDDVMPDPSGTGFAFIVHRTADGFGDAALASVSESNAVYIYRKRFNGWEYCARGLRGDEQDNVSAQLKSDYVTATKSCSTFQPVTVKPKESPFSKFEIKPAATGAAKH